MKGSKDELPTSRRAPARPAFFPSLLTTPIPDNRMYVPGHHLVSDISLLSEAEPVARSKKTTSHPWKVQFSNLPSSSHHQQPQRSPNTQAVVKYKNFSKNPLESTESNGRRHRSSKDLLPNEKRLIRLRRKYGLPASDNLNYDISSLSSSSDSGAESDTESVDSNHTSRKPYNNPSKSGKSTKCSKPGSKSASQCPDTMAELINSLKKRNAELTEYLERVKITNSKLQEPGSLSEEYKKLEISKQNGNSLSSNGRDSVRSNRRNVSKDSSKSCDYLDTSIEKVREDMQKDIDNANSTPISQRMSSMFVEAGTIYHTPHSNTSSLSKLSDASCSSKYRSSCSVTPEKSSIYYRTSSPKRLFQSTTTEVERDEERRRDRNQSTNPFDVPEEPETNPFKAQSEPRYEYPPTYRTVFVGRSEQSFYVEQLAQKYELDDQFPDLTQYKQLPGGYSYLNNQLKTHKSHMNRPSQHRNHQNYDQHRQTVPKTLWSESIIEKSDEDLKKYSLSNMNTSVATRKYLEKYGLINDSHRNASNGRSSVICEEDEDEYISNDENVHRIHAGSNHSPKGHRR